MAKRTWTQIKTTIHELATMELGLRMRLTPIAIGWGNCCIDALAVNKTIEDVADEGKMPVEYIENCYTVVSAWRDSHMPEDVPFSVFEDLIRPAYQAKLVELNVTKETLLANVIAQRTAEGGRVRVDDIRRALGVGLARRKRTTVEDRATTAAHDLRDPQVVDHVVSTVSEQAAIELVRRLAAQRPDALAAALNDDDTSVAVTRAFTRVGTENRDAASRTMREHGFGGLERSGAYYDVLSDLTHILQRAKSAYDSMAELDGLSDRKIQGLLKPAKRAQIALGYVIDRLEGGTADLDEEFALLLEGDA